MLFYFILFFALSTTAMSPQYFVLTLISFLISISITFYYFNSIFDFIYLFSIYIFLFNNFISSPFCVVSTTAMWTLMPIFCFILIYFLLLHFLFIFFYSITLFFSFLCCVDDCNVNTHANILFEL